MLPWNQGSTWRAVEGVGGGPPAEGPGDGEFMAWENGPEKNIGFNI